MKGCNSGLTEITKEKHLEQMAAYRDEKLRKQPELRRLFFEMTIRCNERCRHCGSSCGDTKEVNALTGDEIKRVMREVKEDFGTDKIMLCITGGEPLLRQDFFEIMAYAAELGFHWGMTSNGTLITKETAQKLADCRMRTISISVDGMKESHEWFRQSPGSYERTLRGIRNLLDQKCFEHVQITTVANGRNFGELEEMYQTFSSLGIRSWRLINMEPIGRAKTQPELLLSPGQYRELFDFIRSHRFAGEMEVTYGCSHYLGPEYEREVRPWYFLCNAGIYTASVMYNGDMTSCLDLERRDELVEGNVRRRRVSEIWKEGYRMYRSDYRRVGKCADCAEYRFCAGDSFHSWNFDRMEPDLCFKGILF